MSPTLKKGLAVLLGLAIVIGLSLNYLASNLDSIVATVIEKSGSRATGVKVSVDSVAIHLEEGKATIKGLKIGNPPGFESDYALLVDLASLDLDVESLGSDVVIIDSIIIDSPSVNYEQQINGSNLQNILDNLAGDSRSGGESGDTGNSVKIIIEQFDFTNASTTASAPALDKVETIRIRDVRLQGIGRKTSGVTAAEAAEEILTPIIRQSVRAAAGVTGDQFKQDLLKAAEDAIRRRTKKGQ